MSEPALVAPAAAAAAVAETVAEGTNTDTLTVPHPEVLRTLAAMEAAKAGWGPVAARVAMAVGGPVMR